MTAEEKILAAGYEGVTILENYSYDDALVGVTEDGRAVGKSPTLNEQERNAKRRKK